jgi:polyisoprenoid-binding protein YceI
MGVAEQTGTTTRWALDPSHTTIEFSVKHMMFTTVKGHFAKAQGTIVLDETDITRSSVEVEIDAASINTREERRDAHLRSPDFFDVEQHPLLTFKSTEVEREDENNLKVTGDLTIRGTTRPVVLKTEITGRGRTPFGTTVSGFSATTTINRKDYNLNWNVALEAGGWLVGDTIKVAIEAEAILQA